MTFRDLFEGMHEKDPAILGGALAGSDGLAVEEWRSASAPDMPALCAEMAQLIKEAGRIAGETGLGAAREVLVAGDAGMVFLRRVTDDYFLLLVTGPDAVPGKCRFLMRQGAVRAIGML